MVGIPPTRVGILGGTLERTSRSLASLTPQSGNHYQGLVRRDRMNLCRGANCVTVAAAVVHGDGHCANNLARMDEALALAIASRELLQRLGEPSACRGGDGGDRSDRTVLPWTKEEVASFFVAKAELENSDPRRMAAACMILGNLL